MMAQTRKQSALITGASRGLGLALARELAGKGWNLIIDARGAEALEAARKLGDWYQHYLDSGDWDDWIEENAR